MRLKRAQDCSTGMGTLLPRLAIGFALVISVLMENESWGAPAELLFKEGIKAYETGDYTRASQAFSQAVARQPASGTLQNLGNAEWQRDRVGAAILAWERATWLDAYNGAANENLRFARKAAQLESPDLAWYEVISTWLPVNWWAWITGLSLWLAVGMVIVPAVLVERKATWHQAVAAFGLMVFLLSVPAHAGVYMRAKIGFVLQKDTPLRLTPTHAAQVVTHLAAGDPARWERAHGRFLLIRTGRTTGWIEKDQLGLICPTR